MGLIGLDLAPGKEYLARVFARFDHLSVKDFTFLMLFLMMGHQVYQSFATADSVHFLSHRGDEHKHFLLFQKHPCPNSIKNSS